MKKNLKLLISSLMLALIFTSPQALQSTELEPADEPAFKVCPKEITAMILHHAAIDECLNNRSPVNILLVCKEWRELIEEESIGGKTVKELCQEAWYGVPGHEEIYDRFLKGVLIYRPQEGSDEGIITMRISELLNPLEGTFDLSQCGEVGKCLSISTGYRKRKNAENGNKVEIWLAPRFLIEKKLKTTASHFQDIYEKWNDSAPVGIFLTWGKWNDLNDHDYLLTENFDQLSYTNLYEKSRNMKNEELWSWIGASMQYMHVHFEN